MTQTYDFQVNGTQVTTQVKGTTPLLYVLRNDLNLKTVRFGCGQGDCGACTVVIDDKPMQACDITVEFAAGSKIETVEGLGTKDAPHLLVQTMLEEQAGQCGYCMPGIIMQAKTFLENNPKPTRSEIASALDGHLCRCGTHHRILRSIERVAAKMSGQAQ